MDSFFDDFMDYSYSNNPYTDPSFTYSKQKPCNPTQVDSNIQLIKSGDQTVVQLSIEQLQKFMSTNNADIPMCRQNSFDSHVPNKDDYYTSSYEYPQLDESDDFKVTKLKNGVKRAQGHHIIERRYRQNLNDKIDRLKNLVLGTSTKVSKGAVLDEAAEAIISLRNKVSFLQKRILQLENLLPMPKLFSESSSPSNEFCPSVAGYAERSHVAYCFFALVLFLLNPFSYLLQSRADVMLSFSSFFKAGSSLQTRSLLSHGESYSSVMGPVLSLGLFVSSHLLNALFMFVFLFYLNLLLLSTVPRSSWELAGGYIEKAHKCIKTGSSLREREKNILLGQSCLGFSTPSGPLTSGLYLFLTLINLPISLLVCPFFRVYHILCRNISHVGDFKDYMGMVTRVALIRGMIVVRRGTLSSLEEVRILLIGVGSAVLSGDSRLVSQMCSVTALAFRFYSYSPIKSTCSFLLGRVASMVTESDRIVVAMARELFEDGADMGDYSRVTDYNTFVCLAYIDHRLIKCLNGLHLDFTGLRDRIDFAESLCGDLSLLLDYRRSILSLAEFRTRGGRVEVGLPRDSVMVCAGMLFRIESSIHVCSLSNLPSMVELCGEANRLLLGCEDLADDLLSRHFYVFVSKWLLGLRQNMLTYAECFVSTDSIVSLFENDFGDVCQRASLLDGKVLGEMARFSREWNRL